MITFSKRINLTFGAEKLDILAYSQGRVEDTTWSHRTDWSLGIAQRACLALKILSNYILHMARSIHPTKREERFNSRNNISTCQSSNAYRERDTDHSVTPSTQKAERQKRNLRFCALKASDCHLKPSGKDFKQLGKK